MYACKDNIEKTWYKIDVKRMYNSMHSLYEIYSSLPPSFLSVHARLHMEKKLHCVMENYHNIVTL